METPHKALLVGASGMTGKLCLKALLYDDFFKEVEIWVRKTTGITHPKLTERIIDFSTLETLTTNAQSIFCCLGTTIKIAGTKEAFRRVDHDYVAGLAIVAKRSAARQFLVISSIGANAASGNFYLRTKGEMEDALKQASLPSVSILRPSFLMGYREQKRTAESVAKVIMKMFGWLLAGSLKKYRGIEGATVIRAMIDLAKKEKPGFNIYESGVLQEIGRKE